MILHLDATMNDAYAFGWDRRADGSTGFDLTPWTPDLSPPTPAPPPLPQQLARRGPRVRMSRSAPKSPADQARESRVAKFAHNGKALRIDCPGGECPI
jgi:hypothetical protein